jgi:hypothetical protein
VICVFLLFDFFHYTDINSNGINVKKGSIYNIKYYSWDDVENVKVIYKYWYKSNIDISYNIYLNDGSFIDAFNSKHCFDIIIKLDEFIQKKNILIVRSEILNQDKAQFEMQFGGKGSTSVNRFNVLKTIFTE